MTIDKLIRLMPPPSQPLYPGSRKEWRAFQEIVGLVFPEDFYTVASTYGSGRFLAGEFKVANPFDPDDHGFADVELMRLRETKKQFPKEVPYSLFPDSGGLYPFGIDGNGNTFLWKTNANSSRWPIVCFNSEDYSELTDHPLIDFLVLLASNELDIDRRKFWGNDFSHEQLEFVPRRLTVRHQRKTKK